MNCKDFSEIADSYLSNELLVETNHDVLRHLESCRDCRELLTVRRMVKERLRAIRNADEFRIDPRFAADLKAKLRNEAVRPGFSLSGFQIAFAGAAATVMIVTAAFFLIKTDIGERSVVVNPPPVSHANNMSSNKDLRAIPAVLVEASADAIDDHKNCALKHNLTEKPISLDEAAKKVDIVNAGFDTMIVGALTSEFGDQTRLIKAHYCMINGRYFTHVVLESQGRIVSVLLTKLRDSEAMNSSPAACGESGELRSVCFATNGYGLFVVSDGGEDDGMAIANAVFDAVRTHLNKGRFAV